MRGSYILQQLLSNFLKKIAARHHKLVYFQAMIFLIASLLPLAAIAEDPESDFAKNPLLSLFGYSPLIGGEEKELRSLHSKAEGHMKKKEFALAENAYQQILDRCDPPFISSNRYSVDWPTYIDLVLRLSDAKFGLKDFKQGEKLLVKLTETHPPQEYLPSIYFHLARFFAIQNEPGKAFVTMKAAFPLLPLDKWKGEDRSFFRGLEYLLDDHFDKLLKKAKRFALAHNTQEAIQMYQEIEEAIVGGYYPRGNHPGSHLQKKVKYRLAELYFQEAKYEKALSFALSDKAPVDQIDCEMLYLAANAYKEKCEWEKAIGCFQNYVDAGENRIESHLDHALFEIGLAGFRASNFEQAKENFAKIQHGVGKVSLLASIYLARIHLKEGKAQNAEEILSTLAAQISREDPLKYEIAYLRGESAFVRDDFTAAVEFFENALPTGQLHKEWTNQALYKLGTSYLRLSESAPKNQKNFISKAEKIFDALLSSSPTESLILSLGKLYIAGQRYEKAEELLKRENTLFTREGEAESLLLLADAKKTYAEREALLREATSERFETTAIYPSCWYRRGVNDFKEGLFSEAIHSFEIAFSYFEKKDQKMASHILQCEASANLYRNLPKSALMQLERLLNDYPKFGKDPDELIYLRGLVASHLAIEMKDLPQEEVEKYAAIADASMQQLESKESAWRASALLAHGSYFFRQKKYESAIEKFQMVETSYSDSPIAAAAFFWEAESQEKLGKKREEILNLRKTCYEKYPLSSYAPLAYFKCYPFEHYLEGGLEGICHIKAFPSLFPNSPLLMLAYYFIGKNENNKMEALQAYEKALFAFDATFEKTKEHKTLLLYFHHRTILEWGHLLLKEDAPLSSLLKSIALLEKSVKELEKNELLAPKLHEESEFLLALNYLQTDQEKKGGDILSSMLERYHEAGVLEGYYLSCVLVEQGKLAMKHDDLKAATVCLEMAEMSGLKHLPIEEKMTLWILQSECFKRQNKFESAMRLLSKVINEDVATPLRVKAMFLRAEIYELEGRHELAIRQLEATAKRGGTWGNLAKENLRVKYGVH